MSGGVLNIKETQTSDIKYYFNPPALARSDTDDALRSRLAEMGVSKANVQYPLPDLRFIVQGGIDHAASMATVFNGAARTAT
ncbi:conserved hypothetical protein [Pseudomonas sp. PM2]|jgi:hypothetical protein